MNREKVTMMVKEVFEDTFIEDFEFTDSLSANDVEEWDSMLQVSLIINLEKKFDVRFDAGAVTSTKNVGELISLIESALTDKK